jgi:hypothetical protein
MIAAMSSVDKMVLQSIYQHRCLNEDLLYQFFYRKMDASRTFAARKIRWMLQKGLIEPVEYGEDFPALFLTTLGIETYRYLFNIPKEIMDLDTGKMKNALRLAGSLKMKPNNLRHQMALNQFELAFEEQAAGEIAFTYQDEKFLDLYTVIRPDGLIQFNQVDLFLEMDMSTEKSDALLSKWNHYREFLKSREYRYKDRKTIVLFILNAVQMAEQRRQTVLSTLQTGLLDALDSCFEIYVDTPENLLDLIFNRLAPNSVNFSKSIAALTKDIADRHGFTCSSSSFMDEIAPYTEFFAYIRKLNFNRRILVQDGRPQEFLLDVFWDRPLSVLKKIVYYNHMSAAMLKHLSRKIPYLVVLPEENSFYTELKLMRGMDYSDIYFTTSERLRQMDFPEALVQYDAMGNLFHFTDYGLQQRVFERKV